MGGLQERRWIVDNRMIARRLREYARHLDQQRDNLYRVRAYRLAADVVERLDRPVYQLLDERGREGLAALPGIGEHLAYTLEQLVRTGEFHTVRSPREFIAPERVADSLPAAAPDSTMTWADPQRMPPPDSLFSPLVVSPFMGSGPAATA
jgi:DNA polymerase/3'-5' exonuclease PolX